MRHLLLALALAGCVPPDDATDPTPEPTPEPTPGDAPPWFVEVTDEAGLGGLEAEEGSGVAVGDVNGDGWPDLYFNHLGARPNLLVNAGDGTFREETDAWRLRGPGVEGVFGSAFVDLDADGDPDLVLARIGTNIVFMNGGPDAGFSRDTTARGLGGGSSDLSQTFAFADADGDGDLDAWLANGGASEQGDPVGRADRVFRNDGDAFVEVTDLVPLAVRDGHGFIAAWTDVDQDGDMDVYVINDFGNVFTSNQLLLNDGTGDFAFTVATATCACNVADAGMGVGIGDVDRDGWQDLYLSNTAHPGFGGSEVAEYLLQNQGDGSFVDVSLAWGAAAGTYPERINSWGVEFADVDNDGWLDVIAPFGRTDLVEADQLLMNQGDGTLRRTDVEESGLGATSWSLGLGVVDYDGDGCLDVAMATRWDGGPRLYRNTCATGNHWLQLTLRGAGANPDAVGAIAVVEVDGLPPLREEVVAGSTSVHGSRWKTLHFGLGAAEEVERVTITWPDGATQVLTDLDVDQRQVVVQE